MASKRSVEDGAEVSRAKKFRPGFKMGPDNLPDGTYRRKVIKIKHDMIQKAKLKKSYARVKAREPIVSIPAFAEQEPEVSLQTEDHTEEQPEINTMNPERQAMLDEPESTYAPIYPPNDSDLTRPRESRSKWKRKPFEKEQAEHEQRKAEQEVRRLDFERREAEKKAKIELRERFRAANAKARGKNGQRKLGRESTLLLEKVKMVIGNK